MTGKISKNWDIKAKRVFVIGSDGQKIGEMDKAVAIHAAEDEDLDIVLVSQKSDIPIVKITDANKYMYEMKQRDKQRKKNSKVVEVKEIRFSPNIAQHDLEIKEAAARKFLQAGHDVRITLRCRGREISRITSLASILDDVAKELDDCSSVKLGRQVNGRCASVLLKPIRTS